MHIKEKNSKFHGPLCTICMDLFLCQSGLATHFGHFLSRNLSSDLLGITIASIKLYMVLLIMPFVNDHDYKRNIIFYYILILRAIYLKILFYIPKNEF